MYSVAAYLIYLSLSIFTVFVVGKNLHRNGKEYLFGECAYESIATSANNFLYIGYCLVNSAFALFFLTSSHQLTSVSQVIEFICNTQGIIFLSLGLLHVLNVIFAPRLINLLLQKKLLTNKNQKS